VTPVLPSSVQGCNICSDNICEVVWNNQCNCMVLWDTWL